MGWRVRRGSAKPKLGARDAGPEARSRVLSAVEGWTERVGNDWPKKWETHIFWKIFIQSIQGLAKRFSKEMADILSKKERSRLMARIKGRDTQIEMTIRRSIWREGYRYRLHSKKLPGRPDIAFVYCRLAVFIDGCFWHRCPIHSTIPQNNRRFWLEKLEANKKRDLRIELELKNLGWHLLRFWEHEVEKTPDKVVRTIKLHLNRLKKRIKPSKLVRKTI